MEPLGTSVEVPSLREYLENIQRKTIAMLSGDHSKPKRTGHLGNEAGIGNKFIPSQTADFAQLPSQPYLGVDARDRNTSRLDTLNTIIGISGDRNVGTAVSLDGGEPGVTTGPPPASIFIAPPGSAGTHPLKPKLPRERPPRFSDSKQSSHN